MLKIILCDDDSFSLHVMADLLKTAFFKDISALAESSLKGLSAYYSDLTKSITSMQEICHDMKYSKLSVN